MMAISGAPAPRDWPTSLRPVSDRLWALADLERAVLEGFADAIAGRRQVPVSREQAENNIVSKLSGVQSL
jgi:hypothetical protein